MNKNRSYPGAFKSLVQRKIGQKNDISKPLQKQLNKGEGKIENKYPNNSIPKYQKYFRDMILSLCESKIGNILLTQNFRENFPQEIRDIQSEYFSEARKILRENSSEDFMKNVKTEYTHLGVVISNKLYSDGGSEYTEKLENLSDVERKIYDDYIFNLDGFDDSKNNNFMQYFSYILEKNPENKYEYLEKAIQNISENIQQSKQKEGFYNNKSDKKFPESLFSMENFGDEKKNKIIFLQLIELYEGKVDFSIIEDLHFTKDSDKKEIVEAVIGYQKTAGNSHDGIKSFAENFYKIGISDEKTRFEIAKKIAKYGSILGETLQNFSITNQQYLTQLAEIHSGMNVIDKRDEINNTDFINIAYKFGDETLNNYEINAQTISRYTRIDLKIFSNFSQEMQIKLFQELFLRCSSMEENLEVFFQYVSKADKKDQDKIIQQVSQNILLNASKNTVLGFLKNIKNKNKNYEEIYKKILLQAFIGVIKKQEIHIILSQLEQQNTQQNFAYKKDIDIFIEAMMSENKISQEEKTMIENQMLHFNNMRDFIRILDKQNYNRARDKNFIALKYDPNLDERSNSFNYIFDMIGLQQPNGFLDIDARETNGVESMLFLIYKNLGIGVLNQIDFGITHWDKQHFDLFNNIMILLNIFSYKSSGTISEELNYTVNNELKITDFYDMTSLDQMKKSLILLENELEKNNTFNQYLQYSFLEIKNYFDNNWGESENIMRLFAYLSSNNEVYKKYCRTINTIIKGKFSEYKFYGLAGDGDDQEKAQKQLSMMNQEEIKEWKEDKQKIKIIAEGRNNFFIKFYFSDENIQNYFLKNTKISTYLKDQQYSQEQNNIIKNITNSVLTGINFDAIYPEIQHLGETKVKQVIFYIFSQAQNQYQIKNAIKFIKRYYNKINQPKDEFINVSNEYLQYLKDFDKAHKKSIYLGVNSSHPRTLLEIGSLTSEYSCLDINDNKTQTQSLLGYVIDANVKAFLLFKISESDCQNFHQYQYIKKYLENDPTNFNFDENTRELDVGGAKIILNKAEIRNMIFIGTNGNNNGVTQFVERRYGNHLINESQDFINSLFGDKHDSNTQIFPSRNPGGVYRDSDNGIAK